MKVKIPKDYTPIDGEIRYDKEKDIAYIYNAEQDDWHKLESKGAQLSVGLYDINKQVVTQLPDLTEEDLAVKKDMIKDYLRNTNNEYYMLLCSEKSYYTLFHVSSGLYDLPFVENELIECLQNLFDDNKIKAIDLTTDKTGLEIWGVDQEPMVAYFFPYDQGVVECR